MRRKTRRALINLALFASVLSLVIYLNRSHANKTFAWTKIRYKTTSTKLPAARGICPGLKDSLKPALVVSRVESDGDPSWLNALANLFHLCIYTVDAPTDLGSTTLQVPINYGHEAMAYLTFIIDNYDSIPEAGAVFVHGSRWSWHNDRPDYDNAILLAALNVSAALAPAGYHNLKCDWSLSTCSPTSAPQGSMETSMRAMLEPWNHRAASDAALPRVLATLFGGNEQITTYDGARLLLGRTDTVRAQCCAQFAVARKSILQHSRDEYVALRQWLLDGSVTVHNDDRAEKTGAVPRPGRILSFVWHILFLERGESSTNDPSTSLNNVVDLQKLNKLACPRADDCYCRLYGRCNLERCTSPGSCHGQYRLPKDLKLPDHLMSTNV